MNKSSVLIILLTTFFSTILAPILCHASPIQVNETYYGRITSAYQGDAYIEGTGVTKGDKVICVIDYIYLDSTETSSDGTVWPAGDVVDITIDMKIIHHGGANINDITFGLAGTWYQNLYDQSGVYIYDTHDWTWLLNLAARTQPDIKDGHSTPGLIKENTNDGWIRLDTLDHHFYGNIDAGGDSGPGGSFPFDIPESEWGEWFSASKFGFTFEANPVPEPSTILLLGSGLLSLGWYGRKCKKS